MYGTSKNFVGFSKISKNFIKFYKNFNDVRDFKERTIFTEILRILRDFNGFLDNCRKKIKL